ncbi:hypothetical protein BsWGS_09365 [Bradybaena similaris]
MATDTESMHDNMTRLRMKMVQQKLAHERERLQRSDSASSNNGYEDQIKLKNAMLKRQELLDRIRQEQLNEGRPKTYSPRRRYTPSPPPSRRSLPDINNTKHYYLGYQGGNHRGSEGAQVRHVIEHQFRTAPGQSYSQLPPIQAPVAPAPVVQVPAVQPVPVITQPMTPAEVIPYAAIQPSYSWPALAIRDGNPKKDTMFNKSDFMDMMMLQNAQMHHMVMQQLMVQQLTGPRPGTIPYAEPSAPVALMRPSPSVYHHHIGQPSYPMPPMDYYQQGYGW